MYTLISLILRLGAHSLLDFVLYHNKVNLNKAGSTFRAVKLIIEIFEVTDKQLWKKQLIYLSDQFWFLRYLMNIFFPQYVVHDNSKVKVSCLCTWSECLELTGSLATVKCCAAVSVSACARRKETQQQMVSCMWYRLKHIFNVLYMIVGICVLKQMFVIDVLTPIQFST